MTLDQLTRVRMELAIPATFGLPGLPDGFFWVPWDDSLIPLHAEIHYRAFEDSIDRQLFASFHERKTCLNLLMGLRQMPGFLPGASWLIGHAKGCCGTIQSSIEEQGCGMIQNVGVLSKFRGIGLGKALIHQACRGFAQAGVRRVALEVTAENETAYQLYLRLGFLPVLTTFRQTLQPQTWF